MPRRAIKSSQNSVPPKDRSDALWEGLVTKLCLFSFLQSASIADQQPLALECRTEREFVHISTNQVTLP